MRPFILQMQTSIDGRVGRQDQGPNWQLWNWGPDPTWDEALLARFNRFFDEADTILMGQKMIGGYLDHWTKLARRFPHDPVFAFAHRILEMRKVVFSHDPSPVSGPNTVLATRSLEDETAAIKAEGGGAIVAFGGAGFARALVAAQLVDEYQFYVNPVALGPGLAIFEADTALVAIEASPYQCGMVVNRYLANGPVS